MKKVAVQLSGLSRGFEITSKIFEYWNNIFDDIEFTFFLTTWNTQDVWEDKVKNKGGQDKLNLDNYKFLHSYELLDKDDIDWNDLTKLTKGNAPYYTYALYKCNELRKKSGIEFDACITTRIDIFLGLDLMYNIKELLYSTSNSMISPISFATTTGTGVIKNNKGQYRFLIPNDNFGIGHPKSMDKFCKVHEDCFVTNKNIRKSLHFIQAQQLMNYDIYNNSIGGSALLIRNDHLQKKTWPTSKKLKELINDGGVEFLYNRKDIRKFFT